jgi:hypothetical protein
VSDQESLAREIARLLRNGEDRSLLVANAAKVLASHRGATETTAELLLKLRSPH